MGTKTITVREEAYDRLKAMKRDDESFSDLVVRLTGGDRDVLASFGALADEEFGAAVADAREEIDADLDARTDDLFGQ